MTESPCPDCNAITRAVKVTPNLTILQVLHDDTCPLLHRLEPA